jgi:hypothetical protein
MDNGRALGAGKTKALFANPGLVRIARLTGCKNISPVRITGEREIYATDWGVTLRTAAPVTPSLSGAPDGTPDGEITHVGIRAHDFVPVYHPAGDAERSGGAGAEDVTPATHTVPRYHPADAAVQGAAGSGSMQGGAGRSDNMQGVADSGSVRGGAGDATPGSKAATNLIRIKVTARTEEPFEEVILFTNADAVPGTDSRGGSAGNNSEAQRPAAGGSPEGQGELWWKFSKYVNHGELPQYLYAPPEALLLLRE